MPLLDIKRYTGKTVRATYGTLGSQSQHGAAMIVGIMEKAVESHGLLLFLLLNAYATNAA